jgi:hypothetical protein
MIIANVNPPMNARLSSQANIRFPITLILCAALLLTAGTSCAQQPDSTKTYRVETRDGNKYVGVIVEHEQGVMKLETKNLGIITLRLSDIERIEEISPGRIVKSEYWFDNPQSTRYLWSPNGYGLKRGEGYYQNILVFFNQFSVGVSDNLTIGGGLVPLFLFGGLSTPAWITPKVSIPVNKDKINIGVGGLLGTVLGESDAGFGVLYGIFTVGNRDKNASLGLGYGYAGGSWSSYPAVSLSALIRTGPRGYFVTENYFFGGDASFVLISLGGRRIINRTGLDYGLFLPSDTGGTFVAIPWLGLTVPFGNKPGRQADQ